MMSVPTSKFERDGLSVVVYKAKKNATVSWEGVSDARDPSAFLNPIIQQIVRDLADLVVTVDFRKLEYMNSATVSPLIHFVKALDGGDTEVLVIFSDAEWQRTHYQCMKTIARTLKHVRVEVKGPR